MREGSAITHELRSLRTLRRGLMEARAVEQTSVFAAAEQFARVEGILPAPESSHAIKVAVDEAMKCKEIRGRKNNLIRSDRNGIFDYVCL